MKKQILKEFDNKFADISDDRTLWNFKKEISYGQVKYFISKAIEKTREETIREVEEKLPKQKTEAYEDAEKEFMLIGFNDCISEIKNIINKLKK